MWSRRLRPIAAGFLFLLLAVLRPGYLPVPYVIAMIPLGALLVGAVADVVVRRLRAGGRARWTAAPVAALAVVGLVATVPPWLGQWRGLLVADLDGPVTAAQDWVRANVPTGDRIVVDDALWVDLVRQGRSRDDVVWYYKVDTDPAVAAQAPDGWRDYDWIVSTNSLRTFPDGFPIVDQAVRSATTVATFGTGRDRVDVLRVDERGPDALAARTTADREARLSAGRALAANPALTLSDRARQLLADGQVDGRLLGTIATALTSGPLSVTDFPGVAAEDIAGQPRRSAAFTPSDRTEAFYRGQLPLYRPSAITPGPDGLTVTYPPTAAPGVLGELTAP